MAGPRVTKHQVALGLMMVAAAGGYAGFALWRFATLRSSTYDLVIFDQGIRSYSHGHLPVAIVKGVHNGFGPDFNLLGDHVSPILALLAPLYWLHSDPRTLLVAQAGLFAAAAAPLWRFTRTNLGLAAAYCVAGAYLLSFPVTEAVAFDFHEAAFAPLLGAVLFERAHARWWHVAVAAVGLVAVKEDLGLLVGGFGLALLVRRRWRLGLGLAVGGPLATGLAVAVLIPAFGGHSDYYWSYDRLGPDASSAAIHLVAHPVDSFTILIDPAVKVTTLLWLLAISGVTSVLSPYGLAVVPLLAERMFSASPAWWGTQYHYNAFIVVPLLCAGVDGVRRLRRIPYAAPVWAVAVLALAVAVVPLFASTENTGVEANVRAARRAVAVVPPGVEVETANPIGPQLTARDTVLLWDRVPRWAPWVVADTGRPQFPFCSLAEQQQRVDELESAGYQRVFSEGGYVVLHRPGPAPRPAKMLSAGCVRN
jgi:uncharacterized membrane protein